MPTPIIVKRVEGTYADRRGEYQELSDGSMWFVDGEDVAMPIVPRSRSIAMRLALEHPDTIAEFDEIDWEEGGDGWVFADRST
jgi:hypothetical protein